MATANLCSTSQAPPADDRGVGRHLGGVGIKDHL